jgi:hypothetical protein
MPQLTGYSDATRSRTISASVLSSSKLSNCGHWVPWTTSGPARGSSTTFGYSPPGGIGAKSGSTTISARTNAWREPIEPPCSTGPPADRPLTFTMGWFAKDCPSTVSASVRLGRTSDGKRLELHSRSAVSTSWSRQSGRFRSSGPNEGSLATASDRRSPIVKGGSVTSPSVPTSQGSAAA